MIRRPPKSKRTDTVLPYTTRIRYNRLRRHQGPGEAMTTATVLFLDLSRFTALTDVHGDHAAVGAVGRRDCRHGSAAERSPDLVRVFTMPEARSDEHTSELQSLMRISSAASCLKQKTPRT